MELNAEPVDGRSSTRPAWPLRPEAGPPVLWRDFYTGPLVLPPEGVHKAGRILLGLTPEGLATAVRQELKPSIGEPGQNSVILYCATPLKKCFEADVNCVLTGLQPEEPAAYIETRAVNLAGPSDLCVGRTSTWREAVAAKGIRSVDVPGIEYYYLTHALLQLALDYVPGSTAALDALVRELRREPRSVVRIYALDDEMKILLLWLKRAAGIPVLHVEANGSQVADRWSQKAAIHPTVAAAAGVPSHGSDEPVRLLRAETELTPFSQELGFMIPRLPGYTIQAAISTPHDVTEELARAADLLGDRYGITRGCLKPARAGTGARIRTGVPLGDHDALARLAKEITTESDEDYILEAHADYLRHSLGGHEFTLTPSAHIHRAKLAEGATLQIMKGPVWQGNVYFDGTTCDQAGVHRDHYEQLRSHMARFVASFHGREDDLRLVKGGIDFAIARVGGKFAGAVLLAMQDLNLSAYGAEYLRAFMADTRSQPPTRRSGAAPGYCATKVVRPLGPVSLATLTHHVEGAEDDCYARVLTSVPDRWGMIAVRAGSPALATEKVLRLERHLAQCGLVRID